MQSSKKPCDTAQGCSPSGAVPLPPDEAERLASLCRAGLLDTPADPRFDSFTRLAAHLFSVPIALVTLVDRERQWFKAAIGFAQGDGTDRDTAFCSYAILDPTRPLVVEDARDDPRFASNPLVTGPQGIRFYAGAPVLDADGRALGTLCILDTTPRQLSPADVNTLCDLAFGVSSILRMEQAAAARRESEENHRWAVALSPQSPWIADASGGILEVGPQLLQQLGMTLEEARGSGWIRGVPVNERPGVELAWQHSLQTGEHLDLDFHFHMADGSTRWMRSRAAPRRTDAGQILRWYGTIEDIHDRKMAEIALEEGRQRLATVLESTTDLVAFYDNDWRITFLNAGLLSVPEYAAALGKVVWDALPYLAGTEIERQFRQAKASNQPARFEWYNDIFSAWLEIHAYPTSDGMSVFIRNINEQRLLRDHLIHQARHDPLTQLPNRTHLHEEVDRWITSSIPGLPGPALLRLRLDDFRSTSDTFGPVAADLLLQQMADRLRQHVGPYDHLARLDGAEFAILQSVPSQPAAAITLARRLIAVMQQPYAVSDSSIVMQATIGVAFAPADAHDAASLLQAADIALSRAKGESGEQWRCFAAEMQEGLERRHKLLLDLRAALAREELFLVYQPLVDFPQGKIGGFEALLRWRHPERGMISPADFIPVAEESGLMLEIGAWALRKACEDAKSWPDHIRVAVNLSPTQFREPDLVEKVSRTLMETGLPATRLKLEITETVLLEDSDANLGVLHQLRKLGVLIVLDDFGTGYSSLGYLQRFPFHKLKIDQSFVRQLAEQSESRAIVHAILELARALRIDTTAEGIETPEQLTWLVQQGCGQIQGYLLGRPMALRDVEPFLQGFVRPVIDGHTQLPTALHLGLFDEVPLDAANLQKSDVS